MEPLDPTLRGRVTRAPVARLATVRPDGRPHVVPVTFALSGDTIVIAIDHKPKTTTSLQRLRNIAAHPVASVVIDHYEDDWSRLWWVRADGRARIVTEGSAREEMIDRLVGKYPPYGGNRPDGPVIVVAVDRWVSWSGGPLLAEDDD